MGPATSLSFLIFTIIFQSLKPSVAVLLQTLTDYVTHRSPFGPRQVAARGYAGICLRGQVSVKN